VWSLGVTLYYLTFRRLPFQEESIPVLFKAITTREPLYPKVAVYSNKVTDFLQSLLQKRPRDREYIQEVVRRWFPDRLVARTGKGALDVQNFEKLVRAYQDLKKPKKLIGECKATAAGEAEGAKAAA